jgi:hypothetical protein
MNEGFDNIIHLPKKCIRCKTALVYDGTSLCDFCFEKELPTSKGDGHAAD